MKKSDVEPKFRYKDTNFAHESEREFAKYLTFMILLGLRAKDLSRLNGIREGNPNKFYPDFFLPDYDLL